MTVVFMNRGEVELDALLTMGESVKAGDNPIGRFGTGFKYAVATLLRAGAEITLWKGMTPYKIWAQPCTIRGKETAKVMFGSEPMHISINLGRDWEVWQAYRELWSNCKDENGIVSSNENEPSHDWTMIVVRCEAFDEIHRNRAVFLLSEREDMRFVSKPLSPTGKPICEATEGSSHGVYYKGILVGKFKKPTLYTYNLGACDLSEDRTLKYEFQARALIAASILAADEEAQVQMLTASRSFEEAGLAADDYSRGYDYVRYTENDLLDRRGRVVTRIMGGALASNLGEGFGRWYMEVSKSALTYDPVELSDIEKFALEEGRRLAIQIEPGVATMPILVVSNLGGGILGMAKDGKCYLARQTLVMGDTMIAGTIFEEWAHIVMYYQDESRDFQNFLLNKIATMAKNSMKPVVSQIGLGDGGEIRSDRTRTVQVVDLICPPSHLSPIDVADGPFLVEPMAHSQKSA